MHLYQILSDFWVLKSMCCPMRWTNFNLKILCVNHFKKFSVIFSDFSCATSFCSQYVFLKSYVLIFSSSLVSAIHVEPISGQRFYQFAMKKRRFLISQSVRNYSWHFLSKTFSIPIHLDVVGKGRKGEI